MLLYSSIPAERVLLGQMFEKLQVECVQCESMMQFSRYYAGVWANAQSFTHAIFAINASEQLDAFMALKERPDCHTFLLTSMSVAVLNSIPAGKAAVFRPVTIISVAHILNGDYTKDQSSADVSSRPVIFKTHSVRILVVDDNQVNLDVAAGLLKHYGISVDQSLSGRDALRKLAQGSYDIVFMDHMMPGMDGVETTHTIRKMGGKYSKLTVIALSANAVSGAADLFISSGMNDFLSKPIVLKQLSDMLRKWLPPEKIASEDSEVVLAASLPEADYEEDPLFALSKIAAVNVALGLSRTGEDRTLYLTILRSFLNVVFDKERIITEYREQENWNDYRIEVHGLKSALANIGAQVLSDVAKTLEHAAIEKDLKTIEDATPLFLKNLHDLAVQLTLILGHKQLAVEVPEAEEGNVKLQLERLGRFIEEWESERALEILAKLPASKLDREALRQIEERLSALNYEGALEIVTQLIQSL